MRWDLAEWLERLAVNAKIATVLGSIPASTDTVKYEGAEDEAVLNNLHKNIKIQKTTRFNRRILIQDDNYYQWIQGLSLATLMILSGLDWRAGKPKLPPPPPRYPVPLSRPEWEIWILRGWRWRCRPPSRRRKGWRGAAPARTGRPGPQYPAQQNKSTSGPKKIICIRSGKKWHLLQPGFSLSFLCSRVGSFIMRIQNLVQVKKSKRKRIWHRLETTLEPENFEKSL